MVSMYSPSAQGTPWPRSLRLFRATIVQSHLVELEVLTAGEQLAPPSGRRHFVLAGAGASWEPRADSAGLL